MFKLKGKLISFKRRIGGFTIIKSRRDLYYAYFVLEPIFYKFEVLTAAAGLNLNHRFKFFLFGYARFKQRLI